jgi:hypothetical protein
MELGSCKACPAARLETLPASVNFGCQSVQGNNLNTKIVADVNSNKQSIRLQSVDHSDRRSMKNAANCVMRCELQDTPNTRYSNAHCGYELTLVALSV